MTYPVNYWRNSISIGKSAFHVSKRTRLIVTAVLLSTLLTPLAFGKSSDESGLATRSALTGDWWGARSSLADNGVSLDLRHTSFYQGLASGTGDKSYEYGGKMDAFINLDSSKMGLWADFAHSR